ncbi:dihydropteroate synthase [Nocardioides sp. R-C-SC26]|uniref:dihydropteroate synthase n=1 Tax=Nocardioides sp. R-C-SC26 TaxID=2870414 RepID=UPI001E413893|nr:dihydropteroate synthase [Nocardioides sp. R-C-SC26]
MIDLATLAALATTHADELARSVEPFVMGGRSHDTDERPIVMGAINLSRDSTYRESVAVTTASAIRKGRVMAAQGAHLIDVGAESSRATADRVDASAQSARLVPVVEALAAEGLCVSVEGYDTAVVRAGLTAGAAVVNLTGSTDDDAIFALAAEHGASVVLCHVLGTHARALDGSDVDADPVPGMLDRFGPRIARARELGVPGIAIDPGLGFGFRLGDQRARARYQAATLLQTFRLRSLGVPVCHAMPHAFDLFEDQFRTAEGFFTVLAHLGRTGIYRTHEVPHVVAVLDALGELDALPL